MKSAVVAFVFKQLVKFLKNHPALIPGTLDDQVIKFLADALGV